MSEQTPVLNMGVVGLGLAASMVLPAMAAMENVNVVGGADTNPKARDWFKETYGGKTYDSLEALCADPEIDAVWVATPNTLHCEHSVICAAHGKHVIVEKPMAITLDEAQRMLEAANRNGVHLLAGGSRSSSGVVRKMREIVRSGELGPLRAMQTWSATDWMLWPRRPDEIDVATGGGIVYRQAPHQVDSMRLLAGGRIRSVRAGTGQWMAARDKAPGFYTAFFEFEDGTPATLSYNAYGYFMATELFDPGASGPQTPNVEGRVQARREVTGNLRDETAAKEEWTLSRQRTGVGARRTSNLMFDLGVLVVSCERGDMRQSPNGLYVYGNEGTTEIPVDAWSGPRSPELDELYNALYHEKPVLHSGEWGLATLEACLAIMESGREHREIVLRHQVSVPEGI